MLKRTIALTLSATLGCFAIPEQHVAAQAPSAGSSQVGLDSTNWAHFHSLIRPHDHEWRHLKVEWLTDVVAARKKAAAEDKPIVICYTGGAGYNEPLGVC